MSGAILTARFEAEFGPGPMTGPGVPQLGELRDEDRLVIAFADCEMVFTVIGSARGALHLGSFLTPFEYIHWRLEPRGHQWRLSTGDRKRINALRRFYGHSFV